MRVSNPCFSCALTNLSTSRDEGFFNSLGFDLSAYHIQLCEDGQTLSPPTLTPPTSRSPSPAIVTEERPSREVSLRERKFCGFTTQMCIFGDGETSRKITATALWSFFQEAPCILSTKDSELSSRVFELIQPSDNADYSIDLRSQPKTEGFAGTLKFKFLERFNKDEPHVEIAAYLQQGSQLLLDTKNRPLKARILLNEFTPNATQIALEILNYGDLKGSHWTFTRQPNPYLPATEELLK